MQAEDIQEAVRQQVEYDVCQVYQASDRFDSNTQNKITMFDQDKTDREMEANINQEKRPLSTFGEDDHSTKLTQRCADDDHFLSGEQNADLA